MKKAGVIKNVKSYVLGKYAQPTLCHSELYKLEQVQRSEPCETVCREHLRVAEGLVRGGKSAAFTLAEVLITLGVIGVVAAMTIPTLIANINGQRYRSQFKKSISTLNQAVRMNQANYDTNFADENIRNILLNNIKGISHLNKDSEEYNKYFEKLANNNTYIQGLYLPADYGYFNTTYLLPDGSIFMFDSEGSCSLPPNKTLRDAILAMFDTDDLMSCAGMIDVNGLTGPNKEVSCSKGVTSADLDEPCIVKNDAQHMTDIYPVVYYDSTVEPATNAAKYVLNTAK
ncbi:type II secretion system protein [bacterium]|nr:type II secretion system protein [bacterium]